MHLGFPKDSPFRAEAAVAYMLGEATMDGHTYLPRANWSTKRLKSWTWSPRSRTKRSTDSTPSAA
jgi:hypothetical protein